MVAEGEFDRAVLDASGLPYEIVTREELRFTEGIWVAISRDPETGKLIAAAPTYTNGRAVAY